MKRWLLLLALLWAVPSFAQVAVSGNVQDIGVANVTSGMEVSFELQNYGGEIPRIPGGPVIGRVLKIFRTDGSGNFAGNLYPNTVILPNGTWYRVCVTDQGDILRCNNYLISGPFILADAVPLVIVPHVGPNQLIFGSQPLFQTVAATTWTLTHNFNDPNTFAFVEAFNGHMLYPDVTDCRSNPNVCTFTFLTPTTGFAVAMHAGAVSIATNQPNAIIQNPLGPQVVDNGQSLTVSGPFSAIGGGSFSGSFSGTPILTGLWTFNAGLTSAGPNTFDGGGTTSGNWSHSGIHTFNAAPSFTATPGFSITSSSLIANLNAALLLNGTWASPGDIGGTAPGAGTFTSLAAATITASSNLSINGGSLLTTSNQTGTGSIVMGTSPTIATPTINGASTGTGIQGTDSKLLTAGTVSGTGASLCTSANGGATTSGCSATIIKGANLGSASCTTGSNTYDTCTSVISWPSPAWVDANYRVTATCINPSNPRAIIEGIFAKSTSTVTVIVVTEGSVAVNCGDIEVVGVHN